MPFPRLSVLKWTKQCYWGLNSLTLRSKFSCSTQARIGKPIFCFFVNIFFWQKMSFFFVRITHSSVNFTWFALLSHEKIDDKPLFKCEALCLILCHFELSQNNHFCEIKTFFFLIKFQTMHLSQKYDAFVT